MNRLFYTTGNQDILEIEWQKPDIKDDEIEVKNIITGVCRSDIDMFNGGFTCLPKEIQGHEGLGIITKVGKGISRFYKEGDFVATRGEPSFADYYNAKKNTFVKVPSAEPKYIIEPVACGVNIYKLLENDLYKKKNILILGTGFLATVFYSTLRLSRQTMEVMVVGNANEDYWLNQDVKLYKDPYKITETFDVIIDLTNNPDYFNLKLYNENAIIVIAAEKKPEAVSSFQNLLWKNTRILLPSPRNPDFIHAMDLAVEMVEYNHIDTCRLWTKKYQRDDVLSAFQEGTKRPAGYSRGFIEW
jgi:D-arabinose 1-dehydrogenase-like Zn-dependent alcohol dehydrogenase